MSERPKPSGATKGRKVNFSASITPEAAAALDKIAAESGRAKREIVESLILGAAQGPTPIPKEILALAQEAANFLALHNGSDKAIQILEHAIWTAMAMARHNMSSDKE